ncbi:MAG: cell wall-active antibiotics response protein [Cytophagales bacterium]|nr:cell wall-active antibiotics response protein [Cytophagales bacterium]
MRNRENKNRKEWLGLFLVIFGGYFLLRNLDMIPSFIPSYLFGWEMILIVIGGSMLVTGRFEGFIILAIGGLFLAQEIFYWPHFHIREWWPILLIIGGITIFMRRREYEAKKTGEVDDDFLNDSSVFGGSEKSFTSQNFKGGKITSIFGGSEINLTEAKLADEEVTVDFLCLFGGNVLIVPNDWTVINESFVIFGGYADKRARSSVVKDPKKVLRIKGSIIFGGAEVKSY